MKCFEIVLEFESNTIDDIRGKRQISSVSSSTENVLSTMREYKEQKPVCRKEECKSIATRMLSQMNHSVDPCEDFYDYACGGYNFDNEYEENLKRIDKKLKTITNKDVSYLRTFKNVYENCLSFHENYDFELRLQEGKNYITFSNSELLCELNFSKKYILFCE